MERVLSHAQVALLRNCHAGKDRQSTPVLALFSVYNFILAYMKTLITKYLFANISKKRVIYVWNILLTFLFYF